MVAVDEAVIARLKTHGQLFEVLVDCDNALALRGGRDIPLSDVLATSHVYADAKKGLEASEQSLEQIFGSKEADVVAKEIIKKGEIQLTQEHREKLREQKRRQIITIIHRNGVDPKTHLPHPVTRLENALAEAKFHVDEHESVEKQVQDVLKKLKPILPIKFEIKELSVKIGPQYAAKSYSILKTYGTILKEAWQNDGYWVGVIEIPGGMEEEFYEKMNDVCHGEIEVTVTKTK